MTGTLTETRVSELQVGDLWLLDGAWVKVIAIEAAKHPDDRYGIDYEADDDGGYDNPRGFEVAVVKRYRTSDPNR